MLVGISDFCSKMQSVLYETMLKLPFLAKHGSTFNPSRGRQNSEFKAILVYLASSRSTRTMQCGPVSATNKQIINKWIIVRLSPLSSTSSWKLLDLADWTTPLAAASLCTEKHILSFVPSRDRCSLVQARPELLSETSLSSSGRKPVAPPPRPSHAQPSSRPAICPVDGVMG